MYVGTFIDPKYRICVRTRADYTPEDADTNITHKGTLVHLLTLCHTPEDADININTQRMLIQV
jgi:hypothetical protein